MLFLKSIDKFILLYVYVFNIRSHSAHKGVATLCKYSGMVSDPIILILLSVVWLMGNGEKTVLS